MPGIQGYGSYGNYQQMQTGVNNQGYGNYGMQQGVQNSFSSNQQTMRIQPSALPGRVVNQEQDILPNEVPMNGDVGFFVQKDLQKIYAKTWGGDGCIHTNVYQLVSMVNGEDQAPDPMSVISERLDNIEKAIREIRRPNYPKKNYNHRYPNKEREEKVDE